MQRADRSRACALSRCSQLPLQLPGIFCYQSMPLRPGFCVNSGKFFFDRGMILKFQLKRLKEGTKLGTQLKVFWFGMAMRKHSKLGSGE